MARKKTKKCPYCKKKIKADTGFALGWAWSKHVDSCDKNPYKNI